MSILVRFSGTATSEQYDESVRRVQEAGDFPPDGLEYHLAFNVDGGIRVSEIWDSPGQFQAFGARLMPILEEVGIDVGGEPEVFEVHNIVRRS